MFKPRTILGLATIVFGISVIFAPLYAVNAPVNVDYGGEVYMKPLPYVLVKPTCNCMEFARHMGVMNIPVEEPMVGGGIITSEGSRGHIMVILEIDDDSFIIVESNYISCRITYRRIYFDYSKIVRFVR